MGMQQLVLVFTLVLVRCEPTVQAIHYGQDGCSYCRMTIVDELYGSELLTNKGKAFKFDSIECQVAFILKGQIAREAIEGSYFTDFEDPGQLHPLGEMIFVQSKKLKSPMGLNISAFRVQQTADNVAELYFGETMTWDQILDFVENAWLR